MERKLMMIAILSLFLHPFRLAAQEDDLMNILNEKTKEQINYTSATFKSTRILNGHSIERMPEGQLDFRVSHRFGRLNMGAYEFFGLDQANTHFSLEYGIKNWVMVGVGRGGYEKTYDGFVKFSILRQSTGARVMPISLSALATTALKTIKWQYPDRANYFSSRLSYVYQVLIGRKFNERFSAEINPTLVHRNLVATELDPNDLFAVGLGGRMKLSTHVSFNVEYYYVVKPIHDYMSQPVYDPLSMGFDIETGGHVFQLFFTNSVAMIEKGFITETTGQWSKGDIHFGFNISRVFTLKSNKGQVK